MRFGVDELSLSFVTSPQVPEDAGNSNTRLKTSSSVSPNFPRLAMACQTSSDIFIILILTSLRSFTA